MTVQVKICGIRTEEALTAAIEAGADFIGLVHVPASPRFVSPDAAAKLASQARGRVRIVSLVVDADDGQINAIIRTVQPDYIQCHGSESPERIRAIAERTGCGVIKAFRVRTEADITKADAYADAIAFPLFDAWVDPAKAHGLTGGTGHSFDWSLLAGRKEPFMLAGGLTPENVRAAIEKTEAPMVDVSSGVERRRGEKDPALIRAFIAAAKGMT